MAAISFPASPALNDIHSVGSRSWKYNGTAWKLVPRTTDAVVEGSNNLYYTNARVASAPAVTALESRAGAIESDITAIESAATSLTTRVGTAEGNISTLTSGLATEKGRVDAVLSAAGADSDSFAEIVTLINSVDTTNDSAFAGYVTSNNSAVSTLQGRATSLESRATAAEGDIDALESRATTIEGAATTLSGRVTTAEGTLSGHVAATNNPHSVTKSQVGLGNVDNTSDANKPVSTAGQTALDGKQIKDVISTTAPSHTAGLRWIDSTDMAEYVSYNGAWVEIDKQ